MAVEIKETSATVRTLEITIPQADLSAPFEKKLAQYKKQVTMKGFRQGMVPKAMVLKQFGDAIPRNRERDGRQGCRRRTEEG